VSDHRSLRVWQPETTGNPKTIKGHDISVNAVAVTPDGKLAVSGSDDCTLKVWDLKTGEEIHSFQGHSDRVNAVSVTPDGKRVVSGSDDKTLKVWDLETREEIQSLEGHSNDVRAVSVTPDGRRAVSGSDDRTLKVWDLEAGECLLSLKGHGDIITSLATTSDGKRTVSGSAFTNSRVWDLERGKQILTLVGHSKSVIAVAVTPDGRRAVTGSWDKSVKVWELETGMLMRTLMGHSDGVNAVSVTTDGRRAVSGSQDKTLKVWDLETGECLISLEGHNDSVTSLGVTPDGRQAISGSRDETLKLWDLETGECVKTLGSDLSPEIGKSDGVPVPLSDQAMLLHKQGDLQGAMALYREEEKICRKRGDKHGLQRSLGNQALILKDTGDLDSAMALYREEERTCRELGDKDGLQRSLGNQALIFKSQGDINGAMELLKEQKRILEELRNESPVGGSIEAASSDAHTKQEASPLKDAVDCSVFAPPSVCQDESFLVQVFAHLPEDSAEAREIANEFDGTSKRRGFKGLDTEVARGSTLAFTLVVSNLEIEDPVQHLVWRGRTESVQFDVHVPLDRRPGRLTGKVLVSQASVPIGHIAFTLEVAAGAPNEHPRELKPVGDSASRYSKAFISYASADRDRVAPRVQMLRPFGIEYFLDALDLEPAERWEKKLYRHIDECDLFLLFWSNAARQSEWLRKETQHALNRKAGNDAAPPEIFPVTLDAPPIPKPWEELTHIHFGDRLLYLMPDSKSQGSNSDPGTTS